MITLKKYFIIALVAFMVPVHAMQQTWGFLRKKTYETIKPDILEHYRTLGLDENATDQEINDAYRRLSLKCHPDKKGGDAEEFKKLNNATTALREHIKNRTFFDVCIAGGLIMATTATVAGLIKAYQLFKEYSSPNTILLEKMEAAVDKAVTLILNLEFDRYNPTKDTDALYLQFDIDPLLVQLSSDEVRNQVKKAILAFDKTLEATYEQCAWHYDGMTAQELAAKNPRLVREMQAKLQAVKEAFTLCKTDLQLDRNKTLEFLKAHYKKMIGFGFAGILSWYLCNKFITAGPTPIVPIAGLLGAPVTG